MNPHLPTPDLVPTAPDAAPTLPRRALLGGLLGAAGVAALARPAAAGPIEPPAGPVVPTGRPLADLEPRTPITPATTPGDAGAVFVIAHPGSYYLIADLAVPANKVGIRIAAPDVSIDLSGFRLTGNAAPNTRGISDLGEEHPGTRVHSGTIESMAGTGIFTLGTGCRFSDLTLADNAGGGILSAGRARFERILAVGNGGSSAAGITSGGESILLDCVAHSNAGVGLAIGASCVALRCRAAHNTGAGITLNTSSTLSDSVSSNNGAAGIAAQIGCVIDGCIAESNAQAGISTYFASAVRRCAARHNGGPGISVFEGSAVTDSVASHNAADGISLAAGCTASACDASFNTQHGVSARTGPGSMITGCIARSNADSGIVAAARCFIRENDAQANGSVGTNTAAIHVTGQSNRIEANTCGGGQNGLWVTSRRNLILRNSSAGSASNWNIFSNCVFGPIINRTAPASLAMGGNGTVASTLATTDPHANFSF